MDRSASNYEIIPIISVHSALRPEIIFHLGPYVYLLKKSFTLLHCMWKCWAWIVGNEWKFMRTNLIVVKSSTLL